MCSQTFTDFELLAVDDGSSDKTQEVLASWVERVPAPAELRILSQENQGAGAARNHGMREARGELIAFLDADDLWSPGYLTNVADGFRGSPQIDALCANSWDEDPEGRRLNVTLSEGPVAEVDDLFVAMLSGTVVARTSAITIRTSVLSNAGFMRGDLIRAQDYEYWLRIAASGARWGFLPTPLVLYDGIRAESLSRNPRRFANAPLPEFWSRDIWPFLDGRSHENFRKYYVAWSARWCWNELQTGLDAQARATAEDVYPRARGCRERLFLMAVRFVPGGVHRLVWRLGSPVKRKLRTVLRRDTTAAAVEFPAYE